MARFVLTAGWLLLIGVGMHGLARYSLTPGRSGESPRFWPATTALPRATNTFLLVLALHPRCPCSRATLSELAHVMTQCNGRLNTVVLFVQPPGQTAAWAKHDLWEIAARIPGVTPVLDPGGREARNFGAFTSGQAALYDVRGRLAFRGGITGARGQSGRNASELAVIRTVLKGESHPVPAPVFGCALETPRRDS